MKSGLIVLGVNGTQEMMLQYETQHKIKLEYMCHGTILYYVLIVAPIT
jgi:hypothetical protein